MANLNHYNGLRPSWFNEGASWDRRSPACTKREARKTTEAGETPAIPGKRVFTS
jgi:hypothetical protein